MVKKDCLIVLTLVSYQIFGCNGEARPSARAGPGCNGEARLSARADTCVIPDHWM